MFVAVPPGRDEHPVRVFPTFTEDLNQLADWLVPCGVTTVAMESTGVYWIPLYEILAQQRIRPMPGDPDLRRYRPRGAGRSKISPVLV